MKPKDSNMCYLVKEFVDWDYYIYYLSDFYQLFTVFKYTEYSGTKEECIKYAHIKGLTLK
jgi:hypothetical protein